MVLICSTYDECDSIYFFYCFFFLVVGASCVVSEICMNMLKKRSFLGCAAKALRTTATRAQKSLKYFTSRHVLGVSIAFPVIHFYRRKNIKANVSVIYHVPCCIVIHTFFYGNRSMDYCLRNEIET